MTVRRRTLAASLLAASLDATAAGGLVCDDRLLQPERLSVRCAIEAAARPLRLRFVARFVGSHDDTRLAMRPTLDGAPLACAPGSRLAVDGEDGEVSLECGFVIAPGGAAAKTLRVDIDWHHAQTAGTELRVE